MAHAVTASPLLTVENLTVAYATRPILAGISFTIRPRQIVAVVGLNGAGKTTILKAIAGLIPIVDGKILFSGSPLGEMSAKEIVRHGVVYIPEGMSVFADMTVEENLEVGGYLNRAAIPKQMRMVFELFPELQEKRRSRAGTLSGGQQRMVTLARGLMARARLLLLDDPFLGLSPKVIKRFCDTFKTLRQCGLTLFIAGQHVRRILKVADMAYLIESGTITLTGPGVRVLRDNHLQEVLFGVDSTAVFA